MRDLTKDKAQELIDESTADFSESIYLYVPSTKFEQPFVMYKSNKYGYTNHYLFNDIKDKFDSGIYKYTPKSKPFDITKHEFSDFSWSINEINDAEGYIDFYNHETCTDDGDCESHSVTKDDAIAIAKALSVAGEDLK